MRSAVAILLACLATACVAAPYDLGAEGGPAQTKDGTDAEDDGGSQLTVDLGDVTPGAEVAFDVPNGALGFNVSVVGPGSSRVGIASLADPRGDLLVRDYRPSGAETDLALGSRGVSAISVPMNDAPISAGRWTLVAGGLDVPADAPVDKTGKAGRTGTPVTSPLRVTVRIQQARAKEGTFAGGTLDVHVYVPEGLRVHDPEPLHELRAGSLARDVSLGRRIDTFFTELERLFGIGRGRVSFHVIDGAFRSATTGDARAALVAQATAEDDQALHIVLTNEMSYGGGAPLLGYSVGMPGTANLPGTVRSGVAVALYPDGNATNDATTILHELGHFVGLLHTQDDDGTLDLLSDTETCDTRAKACAAADNLMAPDGPLRTAVVTKAQLRVVRGSPIYRAL